MNRFALLLLTLPLGACATDGFDIPSFPSVASFFDSSYPEVERLDQPPRPVMQPSLDKVGSMTVTSLVDGERNTYAVSRYHNGVRVRESDGCVWTSAPNWFAPSDSWANCGDSLNWSTASAQVRELDPLYPIQIGSVGRYERKAVSNTGRTYTRETRCEVMDAVSVLRPGKAATPAFVVECKDPRRTRTTWYAPDEGPIAYRETHRRNGLQEAWLRTN